MFNQAHKVIASIALAALFLSSADASHAAPIFNASGSASAVNVGSSWSVSYDVSGLSNGAGDSLSGFDIDVLYDPAILFFSSFTFTDIASVNQLEFAEVGASPFFGDAIAAAGVIDAFGISGNTVSVLDANQSDAFRFLTLTFTALQATAASVVSVNLSDLNLIFIDSNSVILPAQFANSLVSVTVTNGGQPTPISSTWILVCLGFLSVVYIGTRRNKNELTAQGAL
jgi:hypothetical protein